MDRAGVFEGGFWWGGWLLPVAERFVVQFQTAGDLVQHGRPAGNQRRLGQDPAGRDVALGRKMRQIRAHFFQVQEYMLGTFHAIVLCYVQYYLGDIPLSLINKMYAVPLHFRRSAIRRLSSARTFPAGFVRPSSREWLL